MSDRDGAAGLGPFTILVEPQMGENIGAAARALWNFGWRRMRIVNPRDGWPNARAAATASGAGSLLDEARIFPTTADALSDLQHVYATTARPRELTKRVVTPEQAAREIAGLTASGARVGVLYGPERSGLLNEDIARAGTIITVPVNPDFPSLNLAQCVLLLSYELRRLADATPAEIVAGERPDAASAGEVGRLVDHLIAELDAAHFFFPEHKRANMEGNLRNMFSRAGLTEQDVRTLWGAVRALADGPKRRRIAPGAALPAPANCADMGALRAAIDRLDGRILGLLAEREGYIRRAAALKGRNGMPARIPERVEEVVANVRARAATEGLDPDFYEALWRRLIEAAIAAEEDILGR